MKEIRSIKQFSKNNHKNTILVGPLLGVENGADGNVVYTICFLLNKAGSRNLSVKYRTCKYETGDLYEDINSEESKVSIVKEVKLNKISAAGFEFEKLYKSSFKTIEGYCFYRAEIEGLRSSEAKRLIYQIYDGATKLKTIHKNDSWHVHIPAKSDHGRIAYASCNGWSGSEPSKVFALWEGLLKQQKTEHKNMPYSLLLMGGDQIYSDKFTNTVIRDKNDYDEVEFEDGYLNQYFRSFSRNPATSQVLAEIPSVMMWDDHDICDGWGSYEDEWFGWSEFQASFGLQKLFSYALKFFCFFQLRGGPTYNKNLLDKSFKIDTDEDTGALKSHFSLSLDWTPKDKVLGMDLRSNRYPQQIMSEKNYSDIKVSLSEDYDRVYLMSSIPMGYIKYGLASSVVNMAANLVLLKDLEFNDDLMDHWHHHYHRQEFERFINGTKGILRTKKVVILSGDVHHAGISRIQFNDNSNRYLQLISSGIVHPSNSLFRGAIALIGSDDNAWSLIKKKLNLGNFRIDLLDHSKWSGLSIGNAIDALSGKQWTSFNRNFLSIHIDKNNDNELWANWYEEQKISKCESRIIESSRQCSLK